MLLDCDFKTIKIFNGEQQHLLPAKENGRAVSISAAKMCFCKINDDIKRTINS